jgi:replicative DNA helicase
MLAAQSKENRNQEISVISRGLKLLARELNIPVVALSQLTRGLESRDNKRPMLHDLRDSGSLEQDADVVLFIYRDDYYNPDTMDLGIAEIIVSKNRQGENGPVKLRFKKETTEFKNLASGMVPIREAA